MEGFEDGLLPQGNKSGCGVIAFKVYNFSIAVYKGFNTVQVSYGYDFAVFARDGLRLRHISVLSYYSAVFKNQICGDIFLKKSECHIILHVDIKNILP